VLFLSDLFLLPVYHIFTCFGVVLRKLYFINHLTVKIISYNFNFTNKQNLLMFIINKQKRFNFFRIRKSNIT
jgi:hypothetical protein